MRGLKAASLASAAVACGVMFSPVMSRADTTSFVQTSDHCTGGCLINTNNTIAISDVGTGTNTVFTFTISLTGGYFPVSTGFDTSFAFSSTLSDLALSTITGYTTFKSATSVHMDGVGNFQPTVYGQTWGGQGGGAHDTHQTLTFTATTGTAITLATFLADLEASSTGALFALDVINTGTGNTGLIDFGSGTPTVPLPGAVWLFGTALVGMGVLGRRRRKTGSAQV